MAILYLKEVESGRRQPYAKMLRHSDIIITSLKKELLNSFVDFRKKSKIENDWMNEVTKEDAEKFLLESGGKKAFVALRDNSIVGQIFTLEMKESSLLTIRLISVLKSEYGRTTAKQLLEFAEKIAIDNKYKTIDLYVDKTNARAISFYTKHGYQKTNKSPSIKTFRYIKTL